MVDGRGETGASTEIKFEVAEKNKGNDGGGDRPGVSCVLKSPKAVLPLRKRQRGSERQEGWGCRLVKDSSAGRGPVVRQAHCVSTRGGKGKRWVREKVWAREKKGRGEKNGNLRIRTTVGIEKTRERKGHEESKKGSVKEATERLREKG